MKRRNVSPAQIRASVTETIIKSLEAGCKPWERGWDTSGAHRNAESGHRYQGINVWYLEAQRFLAGYERPLWVTYLGAKNLGGHVSKGEHGHHVIFVKPLRITERNEETGEETKRQVWLLKQSTVFNVAQCEGIETPVEDTKPKVLPDDVLVGDVLRLARERGADVQLQHQDRAYYGLGPDAITMPIPEQFKSAEEFAATLLHELTHWTGHPSRCNRQFGRFGSETYAKEELVAEIGASMLCALYGIASDVPNHASYIESWLRALRRDNRYVFEASHLAEQAVRFVLREDGEMDEAA